MSEGYNIKVGVDSRPAERGVKSFTTSLNDSLRALREFDNKARDAFKALDQFSKINTSKLDKSMAGVGRAVAQLNQIKVNKKIAADLRDLGKALSGIKFNGSTSLGKLPGALNELSKIKIDTKIVGQLNALKVGLKGFSSPPKSLAEWPKMLNAVGRVQINPALAKQLAAIKIVMKGFVGPSKSALMIPALLKSLASHTINPSLATNLARLKAAMSGFTGPSAASGRNFKSLLDAFKGASASEINKIATALAKVNGMNLRVSQSAMRMSQSMGNVNKSARAASSGLRQFHQDSMNLQTALQAVQMAMGGFTIGQVAKGVYETGAAYQSLQRTLIAVATSPEEVRSHLQFLNDLTEKMPISLEVATESFKKFAAAARLSGVSAEDTQKVFSGFSMGFAAMGVDAEHSRHAFMALEQIFSKGTVTSEELKQQLGEHLPGAVSILADALGITTGEMFKMMEQGKLTSDAILKMSDSMDSKFAKAASAAMNSSTGSIMQLRNAWTATQKTIFNSGFESGLGAMAKSIADLLKRDDMQKFAEDIGGAFNRLFRAIAVGARILADNKDTVIAFMKAFVGWVAIGAAASALRMFMAPLMILAPLATAAGVAFSGLRTAMLALSAANIVKTFKNITEAFNGLAGKVMLAGTAVVLFAAGLDAIFNNSAATEAIVGGMATAFESIHGILSKSMPDFKINQQIDGANKEFDELEKKVKDSTAELDKMLTVQEQMAKNAEDEKKRAADKAAALTSEEQKLWDQLNPLAAATKEYEDQLKLIDEIAKKRGLSSDQVAFAKETLAAQTLEDRNPVAASVQDMQNQLNAAKAVTAEQKAQNEALLYQQEMLKKGVKVTEEMKQAVYDFHMGMAKMSGEAGNGFERWAASVKDWNDSMQDAIKDGISGLSDELTNFVTGAEYDFRALAQSILRSFVKIQIDSLMKDMFTGLGLNGMVNGQDQAQSALAALSKMGGTIQTAQTNVYTSGLTVNGQPLSAPSSVTDTPLRPALDVNGKTPVQNMVRPELPVSSNAIPASPMMEESMRKARETAITNQPLEIRPTLDTNGKSVVEQNQTTLDRTIKLTPDAQTWKDQMIEEETKRVGLPTTTVTTPVEQTPVTTTSTPAVGELNLPSPANNRDFLNQMYARARASGLDDPQARLMASQAALESGWGKSKLTTSANNYFGMKAGRSWQGETVTMPTKEQAADGSWYWENAKFRKYPTMQEGIEDKEAMMNRRWPESQTATTFDGAIDGLNLGVQGKGYATDQGYRTKLHSINRKIDPNAYADQYAPKTDALTTKSIPTDTTGLKDADAALNQSMPSLDKFKASVTDMGAKTQMSATQQTTALQQTTQASQTNAMAQQSTATSVQQAGLNAQQAGPQFQQAGQSLQQAGVNAQQAGVNAQTATPGLTSMTSGLGSMTGQLSSAIPSLSGFSQALSMLGSLGSPTMSAGLFKEGGFSGSPVSSGSMSASAWASAPHYAEGTPNTSGGHPAILHDNEAVIPLSRGREVPVKINSTNDDEGGSTEFSRVSEGRGGMSLNLHLHGVKNGDDFNKSKRQVQAAMASGAERALRRNA